MEYKLERQRSASEIKELLIVGDLQRAIKRLIDFGSDFLLDKDIKNNAIISISSKSNKLNDDFLKNLISYEVLLIEHSKIISEMLCLIDEICTLEFEDNRNVNFKNNVFNYDIFNGKGISKKFLNFQLSPIDINIKVGKITAIIGENGNGKSTLCKIIAGDLKQSSGNLVYPTFCSFPHKNWADIKRNIGYLPQELQTKNENISVKEILHFYASINGIKGIENEIIVNRIIQRFDLYKYENLYWRELSGGYKLRFALAKILVKKPKFVILDEPLANLDLNMQISLLRDLKDMSNSFSFPFGLIITSQHINEIELIADEILYLKNGSLIMKSLMREYDINRKTNVFEFQTRNNEFEIKILFSQTNYSPYFNGFYFLVSTPREFTGNDLITFMKNNNIELTYFRDISNSSRKILQKNV